MTAPLFTQSLVDTRGENRAGLQVELTATGELRVIVTCAWQELGLLAQGDKLSPDQTIALWVDLGLQLLQSASPEKLQELLAAFQSFAAARGDRRPPPAGELHAVGSQARDRDRMHAIPDVGGPPAPGAAEPWDNPFAPDEPDQAAP